MTVQDVQVIGLPDPEFGEELCACVIVKVGCKLSEQELLAFCRDQIAHYKIPKYVRFVEAFPMTVTGKVQKFKLRQALMAELGLAAEATA